MAQAVKHKKDQPIVVRPRVLVVDDEQPLLDTVQDLVGPQLACEIIAAENLEQARRIIATQHIEVLVTDVKLPDGDGLSLLTQLKKSQPSARAIVITGAASIDNTLVAFRNGALDVIHKPFTNDQFIAGLKNALLRQAMIVRHEKRLLRLKTAVRKLSEARRMVSKKVDLLCNDLISAYGELTRQFDAVRAQEGFRKFAGTAKDLEQLLCHSMDWMLRQLGYSNIALWLASAEDMEFQLGAYMKYTVPGEAVVTEAIKRELVPSICKDGLVHIGPSEMADRLSDNEMKHLAGMEFLGINCTYLGESLATIVFFRDCGDSFSEVDAEVLKIISPVFAGMLATMVKDAPSEGGDMTYEDPSEDNHDADDDHPPKRKKKGDRDTADWWKRGEPPPF